MRVLVVQRAQFDDVGKGRVRLHPKHDYFASEAVIEGPGGEKLMKVWYESVAEGGMPLLQEGEIRLDEETREDLGVQVGERVIVRRVGEPAFKGVEKSDDHDYSILTAWGGPATETKVKGRAQLESELRRLAKEYEGVYERWQRSPEKREGALCPDDYSVEVYDDTTGGMVDYEDVLQMSGIEESKPKTKSIADFAGQLLEIEARERERNELEWAAWNKKSDGSKQVMWLGTTGSKEDMEARLKHYRAPAHIVPKRIEGEGHRYVMKKHGGEVDGRGMVPPKSPLYGVWDSQKRSWVVLNESYEVASAVEYSLNHGAQGTSEADEVASSILDADKDKCKCDYVRNAWESKDERRTNIDCPIHGSEERAFQEALGHKPKTGTLLLADGRKVAVTSTPGTASQPEAMSYALGVARERLKGPCDMLVISDEGPANGEYQDDGRTYSVAWKGMPFRLDKWYVKLDDYGTPEALKASAGVYYPGEGIQHVLTTMLAEEY